MLFDTHAHLNDPKFDEDREDVISRAQQTYNVSRIVNVGYNRETIPTCLELAETYDFVFAAEVGTPTMRKICVTRISLGLKTLHPMRKW